MIDLRGAFTKNWPLKLVSLVMAVTLWFFVTSKGKTELTITVPLELRNIPQDMAVVGDVPGMIEVRLQGQERLLRDITPGKKVYGTLDIGRARQGENAMHLSPDDIKRPAGVQVTNIAPSEISVKLEQLVQRTFRLLPLIQGTPAPGYRFVSAVARPARITLEGPASIVRTFTRLRTLPIDITELKTRTEVSPRVDYQGKPVKILEQDISVTIVIQKEQP
jgi:YbbR domain-containing protein